MSDTAARVTEIVAKHLAVDEASVKPDADFEQGLGADSLDLVELVMAFEEAYDLQVPDDEAEKLRTVNDVVAYIEKQKVAA